MMGNGSSFRWQWQIGISFIGGLAAYIFLDRIMPVVLPLILSIPSTYTTFLFRRMSFGQTDFISILFLTITIYTVLFHIFKRTSKEDVGPADNKLIVGLKKALSVIAFVLLVLFCLTEVLNTSLNAVFKRKTTIIAPSINEKQEEELFASWASMKNKEDWDAINSKIRKYALDGGIIPEEVKYPW